MDGLELGLRLGPLEGLVLGFMLGCMEGFKLGLGLDPMDGLEVGYSFCVVGVALGVAVEVDVMGDLLELADGLAVGVALEVDTFVAALVDLA